MLNQKLQPHKNRRGKSHLGFMGYIKSLFCGTEVGVGELIEKEEKTLESLDIDLDLTSETDINNASPDDESETTVKTIGSIGNFARAYSISTDEVGIGQRLGNQSKLNHENIYFK